MSQLYEQIKHIPGGNGFWRVSSETTFLRAAHELSELGMGSEQIMRLLSDLYNAVAHEFGS